MQSDCGIHAPFKLACKRFNSLEGASRSAQQIAFVMALCGKHAADAPLLYVILERLGVHVLDWPVFI